MASYFSCPPFLSLPKTRGNYYSTTSQSVLPSPTQHVICANSAEPAEPTEWIASTLTRRSGIGAGLAFLAAGVVSQQSQRTRYDSSFLNSTLHNTAFDNRLYIHNTAFTVIYTNLFNFSYYFLIVRANLQINV